MQPKAVYTNMDAFYEARGGRMDPECDSGVHNINDLDWALPPTGSGISAMTIGEQPVIVYSAADAGRMRVTTVETTGDTYAIGRPNGPVALLETLHIPADADDPYHVINQALDGYAKGPRLGKPLSWFIEKIREHNARHPTPSPAGPNAEPHICTSCGSREFRIIKRGGAGAGPRFWHVYCASEECATIIMDVPNDSGCVLPRLAERERQKYPDPTA
ncbi:MAG: hypothetical protein OXC95_11490 [Dehalococcoidia bacterium]|nr:hypothetical protein [Dehalococcoidia bacterium]